MAAMTADTVSPVPPVQTDDEDRVDSEPAPPVATARGRLRSAPHLGSLVGAVVFWFWSLWPTLLPRAWSAQAAISAICAALGWLVGGVCGRLVGVGLERTGNSLDAAARRRVLRAIGLVTVILVPLGALLWHGWQQDHRAVMGMPPTSPWSFVPMLVLTVVLLAVLVLAGRLLAAGVARIDRRLARIIRPRWARVATVAVVVLIVVVVGNIGERRFVEWADASFGLVNDSTPPDAERPTVDTVSGGPGSLVEWDTLGFQGRGFVSGVTPVGELAEVAGPEAEVRPPIRVYVGLDSASSVAEGAELAVRELERTGAFDRSVIVVATATGTGWINPVAARTIEHLHQGDTAIVSQQYSFFPSWVAFLIDTGGASEAGVALLAAVEERLEALPADARPRLVVFGESLGSYGAEAAFPADADAGLTDMIDRTDGALFVGPTAGNPVFSELVDGRDPGSPSWRPELARIPNVRVANAVDDIAAAGTWPTPRVLYLFHPTDAVGTWTPRSFWQAPEWTDDPVGNGVPEAVRWFPLVTGVQEGFDLMAGFSAVPGFGHDYTDAFVDAWAAVAPPAGWTEADTERLRAALDGG